MKRSCIRVAASAATSSASAKGAADMTHVHYDAIVVGGGLSGCLVAGRLAMENMKTLLIERGCDVRKRQEWHRTLPCSCLLHRIAHRGYELAPSLCTTTPQRSYYKLSGNVETLSSQEEKEETTQSQQATVAIPTPSILGGHGVMGSRSWYHGDGNDWADGPWNFRETLLPKLRSLENPQVFSTHRGKRGKFTLSNPCTYSPYYKPFCESISSHASMTGEFVRKDFSQGSTCGRPEMWVDPTTHKAHSTLERFVMLSLQLQRPLTVECNTIVESILADTMNGREGEDATTINNNNNNKNTKENDFGDGNNSKKRNSATGVLIRRNDEFARVHASQIILCAGALGSAQILHASTKSNDNNNSLHDVEHVGEGFWDVPQVVLQYRTKDRRSHNFFNDAWVQNYLKARFQFGSVAHPLLSSWDDMIWYYSSTNQENAPDVEIIFQPFTINNDGSSPLRDEHGCQFVIRPLRPKSRGCITADGCIDPQYFTNNDDQQAVEKAVRFVKNEIINRPSFSSTIGKLVNERLESSGHSGGSCSAAVDLQTFQLNNTSNVYVCDGSILPFPISGALLPYKLALADIFVDKLVQHKKEKAKAKNADGEYTEATRIIY